MKNQKLRSHTTNIFLLFAIAFAMLFAGCKDNATSPKTEPEPDVSKQISVQGGSITSKDGQLTLDIPAGALSGTETITISKIDPDELGPEFDEIKKILSIEEAYELGPDGLTFTKPVTVTMASEQKALQPDSSLKLEAEFLLTSEQGEVVFLDSLRMEPAGEDTDVMKVSGEIMHFSPLVNTGLADLLTVVITGIPDIMVVGGSAEIHFQIFINTVKFGQSPLKNKYLRVKYAFGDYNYNSLFYKKTSPGVYEATTTIKCYEEGSLPFNAEIMIKGEEQFTSFDYLLTADLVYPETRIDCIKPEEPENVLPVGVVDLTVEEVEALAPLFFSSGSSNAVAMSSSSENEATGNFGPLTGSYPAVISGKESIVVIDLLTNEVLLEVTGGSVPAIGPYFGAIGLIEDENEPAGNAEIIAFGANGYTEINTDGTYFINGGSTYYDAVPAGGSIYANVYARISPEAGIRFDTPFGHNTLNNIRAGRFDGELVSAWLASDEGGKPIPLLAIDRAQVSGLYYKDDIVDGNAIKRIADLGLDARKIRCIETGTSAYICAVTLFGDDEIAIITWTGEDEPVVVGTAPAGDGPVDLSLTRLENGNVAIVTTGFNDNTVTETEVSPDGSVVSNVTRAVLDGCVNPGHAIYVRDGEGLKIVGTCYTSSNYFIMKSGL